MPGEESLDQEEPVEGSVENPEAAPDFQGSVKVRRPYSKITTELDEEDLKSIGMSFTQKIKIVLNLVCVSKKTIWLKSFTQFQ